VFSGGDSSSALLQSCSVLYVASAAIRRCHGQRQSCQSTEDQQLAQLLMLLFQPQHSRVQLLRLYTVTRAHMHGSTTNCAHNKNSTTSDNDNSHSTMTIQKLLHQVVVNSDCVFIYNSSSIYKALLLVSALCDDHSIQLPFAT
jgi:hypothetical protein